MRLLTTVKSPTGRTPVTEHLDQLRSMRRRAHLAHRIASFREHAGRDTYLAGSYERIRERCSLLGLEEE